MTKDEFMRGIRLILSPEAASVRPGPSQEEAARREFIRVLSAIPEDEAKKLSATDMGMVARVCSKMFANANGHGRESSETSKIVYDGLMVFIPKIIDSKDIANQDLVSFIYSLAMGMSMRTTMSSYIADRLVVTDLILKLSQKLSGSEIAKEQYSQVLKGVVKEYLLFIQDILEERLAMRQSIFEAEKRGEEPYMMSMFMRSAEAFVSESESAAGTIRAVLAVLGAGRLLSTFDPVSQTDNDRDILNYLYISSQLNLIAMDVGIQSKSGLVLRELFEQLSPQMTREIFATFEKDLQASARASGAAERYTRLDNKFKFVLPLQAIYNLMFDLAYNLLQRSGSMNYEDRRTIAEMLDRLLDPAYENFARNLMDKAPPEGRKADIEFFFPVGMHVKDESKDSYEDFKKAVHTACINVARNSDPASTLTPR